MSSVFNILDFGAVADGVTNNANAIQHAIDAAAVNGGQVVIPAGGFLSGTLRLKSNIDFHLEHGAVLIGSLLEKDILDFDMVGPLYEILYKMNKKLTMMLIFGDDAYDM